MDPLLFSKLYQIFQEKKWTDNDGNEIVFENFCVLLGNLSEAQKELIVELVERYTWITFRDYNTKLIKVLNKVEKEKLSSLKRILLFPIMKPDDEATTKSSHLVLYTVYALKAMLSGYEHITFKKVETFQEITDDKFKVNDNETIYLLDDYLGSGETIKATLTEILKNKNIVPKDLCVLSISAQKESLDYIKSLDIPIYIEHFLKKGISDYYDSSLIKEKIKIMLEIEKLIPGGSHVSFGYNGSEALITLQRTPDNTFPIFWKEYKKKGVKFEAPFARF